MALSRPTSPTATTAASLKRRHTTDDGPVTKRHRLLTAPPPPLTSTTNFMALPAELRNLIFEEYLKPQPLQFEAKPTDGGRTTWTTPNVDRSNILSVNHQIRSETEHLLPQAFNGRLEIGDSDFYTNLKAIRTKTGIPIPRCIVTSLRIGGCVLSRSPNLFDQFPMVETLEVRCDEHKRLDSEHVATAPSPRQEYHVRRFMELMDTPGYGLDWYLHMQRGAAARGHTDPRFGHCCFVLDLKRGVREIEKEVDWSAVSQGSTTP